MSFMWQGENHHLDFTAVGWPYRFYMTKEGGYSCPFAMLTPTYLIYWFSMPDVPTCEAKLWAGKTPHRKSAVALINILKVSLLLLRGRT